jgi:hypothetical protein
MGRFPDAANQVPKTFLPLSFAFRQIKLEFVPQFFQADLLFVASVPSGVGFWLHPHTSKKLQTYVTSVPIKLECLSLQYFQADLLFVASVPFMGRPQALPAYIKPGSKKYIKFTSVFNKCSY